MKIVAMIKDYPPLIYFVNRIHEEFPLDLIIIEQPTAKGAIRTRLKKEGFWRTLAAARRRIQYKLSSGRRTAVLNQLYGDKWKEMPPDVPVFQCKNINSKAVQEKLDEVQPDVIVVEGTGIIKNKVLKKADLALNLHWGLSPYYRGTHCTDWALVNWDPLNIGVTIHKLTKIIDGGSIAAQGRPEITPEDTAFSIDMKLTKVGVELMVDVLRLHVDGQQIRYVGQDLTRGYLTLNRQFTDKVHSTIRHIERAGLIGEMLEHPSRKERLPIVTLSDESDATDD